MPQINLNITEKKLENIFRKTNGLFVHNYKGTKFEVYIVSDK